MINKTIVNAINEQIAKEMYSSNLYLSMASYFHSANLNGLANWMRVQAQEETFHAMKFYDYVISRGGEVKIAAIPEPQAKWKSPIDVMKATLEHEKAGLLGSIASSQVVSQLGPRLKNSFFNSFKEKVGVFGF